MKKGSWLFMIALSVGVWGALVSSASAQRFSSNPNVVVCDQATLTIGGGATGSGDCVTGPGGTIDPTLAPGFIQNYDKPSGSFKQMVFCVTQYTCPSCPDATVDPEQPDKGPRQIGKYNPDLAAMEIGEVGVWIFWDTHSAHSVTSDLADWSTALNQKVGNRNYRDNTAWVQFNAPGTYNYHCLIHPFSMKATVLVGATKPQK